MDVCNSVRWSLRCIDAYVKYRSIMLAGTPTIATATLLTTESTLTAATAKHVSTVEMVTATAGSHVIMKGFALSLSLSLSVSLPRHY